MAGSSARRTRSCSGPDLRDLRCRLAAGHRARHRAQLPAIPFRQSFRQTGRTRLREDPSRSTTTPGGGPVHEDPLGSVRRGQSVNRNRLHIRFRQVTALASACGEARLPRRIVEFQHRFADGRACADSGSTTVRGARARYARRVLIRTSCRACTERSRTSRAPCAAPTGAFPATISRSTSTSSSSASTAAAARWRPFRRCSGWAPSTRTPPTSRSPGEIRQRPDSTDMQKRTNAPSPSRSTHAPSFARPSRESSSRSLPGVQVQPRQIDQSAQSRGRRGLDSSDGEHYTPCRAGVGTR
jgi:hypothetical protein